MLLHPTLILIVDSKNVREKLQCRSDNMIVKYINLFGDILMKIAEKMINFTVGPVQSTEKVKLIGTENVPYFRTPEFSAVMLENERYVKQFAGAGENARVVFITGSGTALWKLQL